jgi:hypothetical protein
MGQHGISVFQEKRYSARQRVLVLQFTTVEEAEAWDRAGQPVTLLVPEVWVSSPTPEDPQHQSDDGEDHEDRPQHDGTVPAAILAQADKRRG